MKKNLIMFLGVVLVALGFTILGSATEAEAAVSPQSMSKEVCELVAKEDLLEGYLPMYGYVINGENLESFRPEKYATYGFIAQRLYHSYHRDMPELPSQKKAIAWLKGIYCEMAKQYPDQAEKLTEAFLDGRGEKWNYKKKASYNFIEKTLVVVAYYTNEGAYLKYAPFSVDNFVLLDRYALDGVNSMRNCYYVIWKNYGGNSKYPSRIGGLEFMCELHIQTHNPPFEIK